MNLLSQAEASHRLKCCNKTLQRWTAEGIISPFAITKREVLFTAEDVEAFRLRLRNHQPFRSRLVPVAASPTADDKPVETKRAE